MTARNVERYTQHNVEHSNEQPTRSTCKGVFVSMRTVQRDGEWLRELELSIDVWMKMVQHADSCSYGMIRVYQHDAVVLIYNDPLQWSTTNILSSLVGKHHHTVRMEDAGRCYNCQVRTYRMIHGVWLCATCESFISSCSEFGRTLKFTYRPVGKFDYVYRFNHVNTPFKFIIRVLRLHEIQQALYDEWSTYNCVFSTAYLERFYLYMHAIHVAVTQVLGVNWPRELQYAVVNIAMLGVELC